MPDLKDQIRAYFDEIDPPFTPVELMREPHRTQHPRRVMTTQAFMLAAGAAALMLLLIGGPLLLLRGSPDVDNQPMSPVVTTTPSSVTSTTLESSPSTTLELVPDAAKVEETPTAVGFPETGVTKPGLWYDLPDGASFTSAQGHQPVVNVMIPEGQWKALSVTCEDELWFLMITRQTAVPYPGVWIGPTGSGVTASDLETYLLEETEVLARHETWHDGEPTLRFDISGGLNPPIERAIPWGTIPADARTTVYLIDGAETFFAVVTAPAEEFEQFVRSAQPMIDTFSFHYTAEPQQDCS